MYVHDFVRLDSQGRVILTGFVEKGAKVRFQVNYREFGTIRLKVLRDGDKEFGRMGVVDDKFRVTIPASFRNYFDFGPSTYFRVSYDEKKDEVVLRVSI